MSFGKRTSLGSGDHQRKGSSFENQGKIPFSYARTSLSGDKSPPMHNSPSDLASQAGGKSNRFDNLKRGIQLLKVKFNLLFLMPIEILPPFSSVPKRISSVNLSLILVWIILARGLAPNLGSYPSFARNVRALAE